MLFKANELLPARPASIKKEQADLANGFAGWSPSEIKAVLRKNPRNVEPMFPYRIPFFKLIFKLMGWHDKDYRKFIKPPFVGRIIRRFVYQRFPENVLTTLLELPNPALYSYVKRFKLYQFLSDEGLLMLEGFIWDAIRVMEVSSDWAEFEKTYCTLYNLAVPPRQQNLLEDI